MVQFGMDITAFYVFLSFSIMAQTNAPNEAKNPNIIQWWMGNANRQKPGQQVHGMASFKQKNGCLKKSTVKISQV